MRRADRLFRIVQLLRAGRLQTARTLGEKLSVSQRTIYRDIVDLQLGGMPIEGEAGVGYTLRRDLDLPPLMFNANEITALVLGSRMVSAWGDADLAESATAALRKIEAVLSPALRDRIDQVPVYAPAFAALPGLRADLETLRRAAEDRTFVETTYTDESQRETQRRLKPVALHFWGNVWTLVAWCELRNDFRSFRVDRFRHIHVSEEHFTPLPEQTYRAFLTQARKKYGPNFDKIRNDPARTSVPAASDQTP